MDHEKLLNADSTGETGKASGEFILWVRVKYLISTRILPGIDLPIEKLTPNYESIVDQIHCSISKYSDSVLSVKHLNR